MVSVILPVYNRIHLLQEAVKSILSQTYADFELLIVDDGSEQDIYEYLGRIKDERMQYHRLEKNRGVAYARNFGSRLARGKYIAVCDSDDIQLPMRLQNQVSFLEAHPEIDLCYGHLIRENLDWHHLQETRFFPFSLHQVYWLGGVFHHATYMGRAQLWKEFKYNEEFRAGEDYDITLRWYLAGKKMALLNEYVTRYRESAAGRLTTDLRLRFTENVHQSRKLLLNNLTERERAELLFMNKEQWVNTNKTAVSVIIPAYNSGATLPQVLGGLAAQSFKDFEVLVVDDGSSEDTMKLVREWNEKGMYVRYFWHRDTGYRISTARNNGLRLAYGDILLFLDSDMVPPPHFIQEHYALHRAQPDSLVVGGRSISDGKAIAPDERIFDPQEPYKILGGCNMSFTRRAVQLAGEFDEMYNGHWGSEDQEFAYRAWKKGIKIIYAPQAEAVHLGTREDRAYKGIRNVCYTLKKHPDMRDVINQSLQHYHRKSESFSAEKAAEEKEILRWQDEGRSAYGERTEKPVVIAERNPSWKSGFQQAAAEAEKDFAACQKFPPVLPEEYFWLPLTALEIFFRMVKRVLLNKQARLPFDCVQRSWLLNAKYWVLQTWKEECFRRLVKKEWINPEKDAPLEEGVICLGAAYLRCWHKDYNSLFALAAQGKLVLHFGPVLNPFQSAGAAMSAGLGLTTQWAWARNLKSTAYWRLPGIFSSDTAVNLRRVKRILRRRNVRKVILVGSEFASAGPLQKGLEAQGYEVRAFDSKALPLLAQAADSRLTAAREASRKN